MKEGNLQYRVEALSNRSMRRPRDGNRSMRRPRDDSRSFSSSTDRISELPVHVLHNILSFLSTKQVFQTSVLSKQWLRALESFPILDFNQAYFGKELPQNNFAILRKEDFAIVREAMDNFMKFVDDSMERFVNRKLRMKSFEIFMTILDDHSVSALDKWIAVAVNSQVEDLNLSVGGRSLEKYKVPQIMYSAACLKALSLCGCTLEFPSTLKLNSLKKLSLEYVGLDNDHTLDRFLGCCPYTRDLTIKYHRSFLKGSEISSLRYLKRLSLWSVDITDQNFDDMIANSTKLEKLDVFFCDKVTRLKIPPSTQFQLSELAIYSYQKVEELEVDAPKLKTFCYSGKPLSSFTLSAPLCYATWLFLDYDFSFNEWINFLSSSVECKSVKLYFQFYSQEITLKRLRKASLPALWRIEELELHLIASPSSYSAIFTSLLVSCKPKILCACKDSNSKSDNFTKYLYCRLKKGAEDCSNSKPCHVKCWRRQLKDVKFTNCIGSPCNWDDFSFFCSELQKNARLHFRLQWKSNETASPSKCEQRVAESGSNDSTFTESTALSQNLADENSAVSSDKCEQRVVDNANDNGLTAVLPIPAPVHPEPHTLPKEELLHTTRQERQKGERANACGCFRFMSSFPFLKFLKRMEECPEED